MDNKTFKELLDKGEIGLILSDGGSHLTPQQMKKVKAVSRDLSDERLQKMGAEIASQPGYQDFMTLPLMSKLFPQAVTPKEETSQEVKPEVAPVSKQEPKTEKEEKKVSVKQKNPLISKISSGSETPMKARDTAADILAKLFNLERKIYKWEKQKAKKDKKYRKQLDDQKEAHLEELVEILTGKKPSLVGRITRKAKKSGFLKYGLMAGGAIGSFFLAEKALANVDWKSIIPSFGEKGDTTTSAGGLTFKQLSKDQQEALLDAQAKGEGALKSGTMAQRMNNPGAIIIPKGGQIPEYAKEFGAELGDSNEVGTMLKFPTMEKGRGAQRKLWENKYADMPLSDALSVWTTGKTGNKAPYEPMVNEAINKAGPVPTTTANAPNMRITSEQGMRVHPVTGEMREHKGIDIAGNEGQNVVAISGGVVSSITSSPTEGTAITLNHGEGVTTTYRHLKNPSVNIGDTVNRADKIGELAGTLPGTTGPHLHFEARDNGKLLQAKNFLSFNPVAPKMEVWQDKDSAVAPLPKKSASSGGAKVSVLNNTTNITKGSTVYQMPPVASNQTPYLYQKQYG